MAICREARSALEYRIGFLESHPKLVIDADTHISDPAHYPREIRQKLNQSANYFHGKPISAEELIAEMELAGIDAALCWQNPSATAYGEDNDANYESLLAANRYIYRSAFRYREKIFPAGWTDPKALGTAGALRMIEHCISQFGFPIVKLNPAQNRFPIDSEPVVACVDHIVSNGAIPAFHFGADTPYTSPEGFATIARRHAEIPIIGVHMGGGGAGYVEGEAHAQAARKLIHELPNIFFIESAKRDTHIESDLVDAATANDGSSQRIALASDAPYGRMAWNFGGYRLLLKTLQAGERHCDPRVGAEPERFHTTLFSAFLGGNVAQLIAKASARLLSHHAVESAKSS